MSNMKNAPDCGHTIKEDVIPSVYTRILWIGCLLIFIFIFFILLYLILSIIKSKNKYRIYIFNTLVFLFLYLQPDVISTLIATVACRDIGGILYIKADVSYRCYTDNYIKYTSMLVMPQFLIWFLIIPAFIMREMF
jgi:hypothetical protein